MTKQLVLSLAAGLLLSLPSCGCKDDCSKKTVTTETTETSVDAQTACTDAACTSCETEAVKE